MKKLILASASPGRKQILEEAGLVFDIVPSNYEEDMTVSSDPRELVLKLSLGKARDVAKNFSNSIIIGADTVGVFDGQVLGKPHTKEKSREMLGAMNGKAHLMLTGLTIIDTETGKEISKCVETKIWFKGLTSEDVEEYVNTEEGLLKAGAYAYQGLGRKLVARVEGSETNILGMPIETLREMLKDLKDFK